MRSHQTVLNILPREGRLWLLAAAGLLLAGWLKGINLLMLLSFLMLALWVVNVFVAARQLRGINAKRRHKGPLFAGREANWDVELDNTRLRSSLGWRVTDRGSSHLHEWFVDRIEGHGKIGMQARFLPLHRGLYRLEPLEANCLHPFGLAQMQKTVAPAEEWLVLPRVGRLDVARFRQWLARLARGDGRMHRVARPSMIRQDDLHGLRPFRPGDSPRWIHWRTSARRNEKMVREFEEAAGQNLILVFDPGSALQGEIDLDLEAAIELTATICWAWNAQKNDQLMLVVAGTRPQVLSGFATRDLVQRMLEALALVGSELPGEAPVVLDAVVGRAIPEAPVVVVSRRRRPEFCDALASAWHRPAVALTPGDAHFFYSAPGVNENAPAKNTVALV